jgi:GH24 family phage-related lysozyme (muramidase)
VDLWVEHSEGRRDKVFKDTLQIKTIGIGFNLEKHGASERISRLGLTYSEVLAGKQGLNNQQINTLFRADMLTARTDALAAVPELDSLPCQAQSVVADMAFSLGSRLKTFKKMRGALSRRDFTATAEEIINSLWCRQVRTRCLRASSMMNHVAGQLALEADGAPQATLHHSIIAAV